MEHKTEALSVKFSQLFVADPTPTPRQGHVATVYNDHYYIFGGRIVGKGRVYTNDLWRFSLKNYTWEKINAKNEPTARHNHTGVQYKNKWIIFSGQDATAKLNDVWELDLTTNEWKQIKAPSVAKSVPTPRHAGVSVLFQNYMIVHGGCDDKTVYQNDIWALNLNTYKWKLLYHQPKAKPIGRSWHAAVVLENRMIISGGYWWDGNEEHYCGDFWEFHFDRQEWNELFFSTPMNQLPHARNRHSVIMSQDHEGRPMMLLMYGNWYSTKSGNDLFFDDVQVMVYDKKASNWTLLTTENNNYVKISGKKPIGRGHQTVLAYYNKQLFFFGGEAHRKRYNDMYLIELDFLNL